MRRSITAKAIYELWGSGTSYAALYESIRATSSHVWASYQDQTFKFTMDCFQGSRPLATQRALIETFSFLSFTGSVRMKDPDMEFCILEDWAFDSLALGIPSPRHLYLGRLISSSARDIIQTYDLKKRAYISTTSMDSTLALITANISLAAPSKLFYDPFVGTGSFPIACSHFGALTFGSDIDGRSIRGKGSRCLLSNFKQYGLLSAFGDTFVADLTNTPLRNCRWLDGIVCDPPYGVREGLKVLGNRDRGKPRGPVYQGGEAHHLQPGYVPPKRPYSFLAMLDDILDFAAGALVPGARLSFWMPTSNEREEEIETPVHPCLEVMSVCTQSFNKWSRRLITYRRREEGEVGEMEGGRRERSAMGEGVSADELNPFRKRYFEGFAAKS
jgi:tRNA (guanine10-N2)-methyltransferase